MEKLEGSIIVTVTSFTPSVESYSKKFETMRLAINYLQKELQPRLVDLDYRVTWQTTTLLRAFKDNDNLAVIAEAVQYNASTTKDNIQSAND